MYMPDAIASFTVGGSTYYVTANEGDAQDALNILMEDIETVLEDNAELEYLDKQNNTFKTQQITIVSIDTDEGVLEPLGVGEILIEVRY